ncbi:TPA: hypothetical protein DCL30_04275 [Candidatus Peribacteria bacterium]|nr:MAG: hypothetical protein A3J91_01890 [Candidatus Peribacteria bacterium RIFOXYC2_FULL_58_10]OGJ83996.1 MAG: hypothetical protein A2529_04330 [Candidatus Peribacteria bacterium RIFOXYD2_FULL_58_15]HAI98722.1 hypothetical protein [Candidatus Peribacteria bacterium]HAS34434.1 hypothetical protein [Candidatus Peribacteria bacterium]
MSDGSEVKTHLRRTDGFLICTIFLIGIGACGCLLCIGSLFGDFSPLPVAALIACTVLTAIGCATIPAYKRIPPDMLGAVTWVWGVELYTDCLVFVPESLGARLVMFPMSQQVFLTPGKEGKGNIMPGALIVQLRQGTNPTVAGGSDRQLVILQVAWCFAVTTRPRTIVQRYTDDFRAHDGEDLLRAIERALRTSVTHKVASLVVSLAVQPLQKFEIEQLLTDVGVPRKELFDTLRTELLKYGIELIDVAIADVLDVVEGGYVARRSEAVKAEQLSRTQQREAIASRDARLMAADALLAARAREIQVEQAIATQEKALIDQRLVNAREQAKIGIADLTARLALLGGEGAWRGQLVDALGKVEPDQLVPFANAFAQAMQSAGLKPNGSLLLAGGDSVNLAKLGTGVGMIAALLKDFGLLPKDVDVPDAIGSALQPPAGSAKQPAKP